MEQKKELMNLIESIESKKALQYLLDFTKAFAKYYLTLKDGKLVE